MNDSMPKTIAFDLDGTLLSNNGLYNVLQQEYPNFKVENFTNYDIKQMLLENNLIENESDYSNKNFFEKYEEQIYYHRDVYKDLLEYIIECTNKGYTVIAVTARMNKDYFKTREWLDNLGLQQALLHCTNYQSKRGFLEKHKVNYFFEDKYETVLEVQDLPDMKNVYLINCPYNQGELKGNAVRVTYWSEAIEHINKNKLEKVDI